MMTRADICLRLGSVLALLLAAPMAARAEAVWPALAIGIPGPEAPGAFAEAFHLRDALRAAGMPEAGLLREADPAEVLEGIAAMAGAPAVLVYYNGPTAGLPLGAALTALREGGTEALALVVENCGAGGVALPVAAFDPLPEGLAVFLAASAEPGQPCPAPEATVTGLIRAAGPAQATLQEVLAASWQGAAIDLAVPFGAPPAPLPLVTDAPLAEAPLAEADLIILDADLPAATAVSSAPVVAVVSVAPVDVVTPASLSVTQVSAQTDELVVFVDPPPTQIAAQPLLAGLPQPSIIVGLIAGTEASFATISPDGAAVSSNEIAFDNLDARRALRAEDPELFETLVANGAFDPPEALLPAAIQTEMARMGCYSAGIDGIWGNGSRSSVTRYFDQIEGESAETLEPTFGLFRQIMRQDDVTCPVVVQAAAPAPAAPRASTNTAAAPRPQAAAQPPRAATPPPAPAPTQPTIRNTLGTGVLR